MANAGVQTAMPPPAVARPFPHQPTLPMGSIGVRASGFWGLVFLALSEASLFAYLLFSYYYFAVQPHPGPWPPSGPPEIAYAAGQTLAALLGCATGWWANRSAASGARRALLLGLGLSFLLALAFVALQVLDWHSKPFTLATNPYSSLYFTIGAVHLAHAVAGVVMIAAVMSWSALGYFGPVRHVPVTIAAVYWYFVTVMWLPIFFTLYLSPYLG